jgi:hypothetical protein
MGLKGRNRKFAQQQILPNGKKPFRQGKLKYGRKHGECFDLNFLP